ncbi:hypothetical protein BDA99DRAFT_496838 [Phascolomyces articulosus]|uniref:Protein kinase domain-containing protein n=1 Tax=Phascolomyces articulosus TaxID=60185 RepID=A0AAD5KA51_9FUNG|nr:hypothetical protein BDA99DRAFT_496838 [Phascolomyces articulosus]
MTTTEDDDEEEEDDIEDYYSQRSLARLRQNSEDYDPRRHPPYSSTLTSSPASGGLENDMIARFSKESLYSYSFNPAFLRTTKIAKNSRKHMIRRGVDFVKRVRYKLDDRITRRFSHPDIGSMTTCWQTNYWSAQNTPRTSIDYDHDKNLFFRDPLQPSASSSSSSFFMGSTNELNQQQQAASGLDDIVSTSSSGSNNSNGGGGGTRRQTLPRSSTDLGGSSLPPIYESAYGSVSPNPRSSSAAMNETTSTETYYKRALHAPTRYLPQNQAIFTTTVDGTILLFNDIASLCFGMNKSYVGKTLLSILEQPFRKQVQVLLSHRNQMDDSSTQQLGKNSVLVCGNVVPVTKVNGEISAASLWLKEKERDSGQVVYIWIFEEIYESTLSARLDSKGIIKEIVGNMKELFGYENNQIIGQSIDIMIPQLCKATTEETITTTAIHWMSIEQLKFYGAQAKSGASFPIMTTLLPEQYNENTTMTTSNNDDEEKESFYSLKITSLPAIAGMLTIHNNGTIQSISPVPAKYLFGYPSIDMIVEKMNIDQLLPQFHAILTGLRREGMWTEGTLSAMNNQSCRKALLLSSNPPTPSATTSNGFSAQQQQENYMERKSSAGSQSNNNNVWLPTIYAMHRDGSHFDVQLQLRSIESAEEDLISIWVSFDRMHSSIRKSNNNNNNNRKASTPLAMLHEKEHSPSTITTGDTNNNGPSYSSSLMGNKSKSTSVSSPPSENRDQHDINLYRPLPQSPRRTMMSRNNSRRELEPLDEMTEALTSDPMEENEEPPSSQEQEQHHQWPPPLPTDGDKHPLDNYVIENTLGEGTYGTAMLAYRKDDETKKKVVIKSITKSRIIVDSWMRDRRFGDMVPAEIHILRTLKANPNINCCQLLTHMEDQEYYYVVMELHGDGMDLFDFIELNETISEQEARTIFQQVAVGVHHLHHLKIVHRDIKDENIILDESGTAVLIDFGSAAYYRENKKFETFCGTMDYWAPELLQGISYAGPPQDIWSLGILLHTLIFRETPFNEIDDILGDELRIRDPPYPGPTNLLHKMLSRDVDARPTIDEVLKDPWLVS